VKRGRPGGLLQSLCGGGANKILLASTLSSMRAICPNRLSRRAWIIALSFGCFVCLRTSSFLTKWYHLRHSNIQRHHWSSASIYARPSWRPPSTLMHTGKLAGCTLYSLSFVAVNIRDLQTWLSRLCMAARVMALRRLMSWVLWVVEWIREPRYYAQRFFDWVIWSHCVSMELTSNLVQSEIVFIYFFYYFH